MPRLSIVALHSSTKMVYMNAPHLPPLPHPYLYVEYHHVASQCRRKRCTHINDTPHHHHQSPPVEATGLRTLSRQPSTRVGLAPRNDASRAAHVPRGTRVGCAPNALPTTHLAQMVRVCLAAAAPQVQQRIFSSFCVCSRSELRLLSPL